jgi:uncharacterized membrane protein (DUF2068 family)
MVKHFTTLKLVVIAVNIALVVYLVMLLRANRNPQPIASV